MATSGGQPGNQNALKAKRWQQAIDRALDRRCKSDAIAELDRLADVYLDTIEDMTLATGKRAPSIAGLADLADRLDGRPTQSVTHGGDADNPIAIAKVVVEIVDGTKP